MHWGLLPPWSKNPRDPAQQINARSETAAEKPMFRSAFRKRRALAPADGFYEWRRADKRKTPYRIARADGAPLAFAALYERHVWGDGEETLSVAMLTMAAHPSIASIHHRMPVMLEPSRWDAWLDPSIADPSAIAALLAPIPDAAITAYPVTARINKPSFDDAAAHAPIDPDAETPPPAQGALF